APVRSAPSSPGPPRPRRGPPRRTPPARAPSRGRRGRAGPRRSAASGSRPLPEPPPGALSGPERGASFRRLRTRLFAFRGTVPGGVTEVGTPDGAERGDLFAQGLRLAHCGVPVVLEGLDEEVGQGAVRS